ncbi:MAG TPA: DNA gyrase modulator, partial [Acidimicrobiales bacterium]
MAELLDIATRVAGSATDGEQIEVYVARSRNTDVRVYQGDIEQLSSADTEGVGIRVVRGGRTGFAYAGVLDEAGIKEVLADARDNAEFGTPDEFAGVAAPDGVEAADFDPYDAELETYPTEKKIDIALELERMVLAADPRIIGADMVMFQDQLVERAIATSNGIANWARRSGSSLGASVLARDGDETQTGWGMSVA